MLLEGAFTALLLLVCGVPAVIVLPPSNMTVSCQNLKVIVSWQYSKDQPQTSFRVDVQSSAGNYVNETTDHQLDLSHFVWVSEERYMALHEVTVAAIQGGHQSEQIKSKTFAFNSLKTADIKCELDFPPVQLKVDSEATVSFKNPFHFYRELEQAIKPEEATFAYTVSSGDKHFYWQCTKKQKICKLDITFPENVEKCVTLKGHLYDGIEVGSIVFRETGRICANESTDVHSIVLITLLVITVLVISVAALTIWQTKAYILKEPIPNPLKPPKPGKNNSNYYTVPNTVISPVTVTKPCKSPSVSSEEGSLCDSCVRSDSQNNDRLYYGRGLSESSNQRLEAVGLISEGHGTDDDSADDSEKTVSVWIDMEEEEQLEEWVSPYDSPQMLDMGNGDMVKGYSQMS